MALSGCYYYYYHVSTFFKSITSLILSFSLLLETAHCFYPKHLTQWSPAGGTWYGAPNGAGTDGGACGYGSAVSQPPFSAMVSAGGPSLYRSGRGCGACYEVKCTGNAACSGNGVRVVITDECPGCVKESVHFDLSGTAFGAMAKSGQANQLRNAGALQLQYRKVECNYPGKTITFRVDGGSNKNHFATVIEYEDGDGEMSAVGLKQGLHTDSWLPMQRSWGAVWKLDSPSPLRGPFSIKITSGSGQVLVADSVIPAGWKPGQTYKSLVNFKGPLFNY